MRPSRLFVGATVIGAFLALTGIVTAPEPAREPSVTSPRRLQPARTQPDRCPPIDLAPDCHLQDVIRQKQLLTK